jgi:hypothetical protein
MTEKSYFKDLADQLKTKETRTFRFLEARTTASIVQKIIQASEARRPALRYVAPWAQGFLVRLARIFGV